MRKVTSTALPGAESEMIFTGRVGYSSACAVAARVAESASSSQSEMDLSRSRCIMGSPPSAWMGGQLPGYHRFEPAERGERTQPARNLPSPQDGDVMVALQHPIPMSAQQ